MAGFFVTWLRQRWQERVRPLAGRRAFERLIENPDETEHVFVVIRCMSGRSFQRLMRRVRKHPVGARIVKERRDLIPLLSDRGPSKRCARSFEYEQRRTPASEAAAAAAGA